MADSLFSPAQASAAAATPSRPLSSPPTATPVTDWTVIESQKENIRPLASGRSASILQSVFEKTRDPAAEAKEADELKKWANEIEDAERRDRDGEESEDGKDVLEVYNRYISFLVQHYPSDMAKLLPQLETTTRRFVNDVRFSQDTRYLKLWTMYARYVERREEVWAFLESREIGTKHSVLYEEWAAVLEGLGRRKKADEILRLGIHRKAAPLERLRTRHQSFLQRLLVTSSAEIPDDPPSQPLAPTRTPGRSVLGSVASASSVSGATQLAPANRPSKAANGAKMEIFVDSQAGGQDADGGEWADLGTRDGRRKENTVEATPWKGETMPQSAGRGRPGPRTPKIEVFKDTSADNVPILPADDLLVKPAKPLSEADLLRSDPLRFYDTSTVSSSVPSLPPPPSARKPPRPAKSKSSSQFKKSTWVCPANGQSQIITSDNGKTEKRMFDWNAVFRGGDEWSFEEVRARQRGLHGKEWKEVKDWESSWHRPGASTPIKEAPKKKAPSPTVNTKLAEAEVLKMFDQTIHGGKVPDSDSDDSDSDDEDAPLPVHIDPTPLAPRVAPAMMMTPGQGFVPPTPTPAAGHLARQGMNVFSDENAIPNSTKKVNIFTETPAKTPLRPAEATPAPAAGVSIFSDENTAPVQATPGNSRRPLGALNIFATPAVPQGPSRKPLAAQVITEEEEEEPETSVAAPADEATHEDVKEPLAEEPEPGSDDYAPRRRGGRFQINEMTPITERTCEYGTFSTLRSSQTTTSTGIFGASSRRVSVRDDVDEEEGAANARLLAVAEEDERGSEPSRPRGDREQTPLPSSEEVPIDFNGSGDSPAPSNESGIVDTEKFGVPEGFTIHGSAGTGEAHTLVLPELSPVPPTANSALRNPCNPSDDDVQVALLAAMQPPLSALAGFSDLRQTTADQLESLQKHAKSRSRRNSSSSHSRQSTAPADDTTIIHLTGRGFEVGDKIGEGGFGAVFLAVDLQKRQEQDEKDDASDDEDGAAEDDCQVAIKVERPASLWEAVILDRIRRAVGDEVSRSIIRPHELYAYQDESFLLLEYSRQGTLLDVVNKAQSMGIAPSTVGGPSAVDELVAVFFMVELLRLVENLHANGFIHGDLKIDNCLVRLDDPPASEGGAKSWSNEYSPVGSDGWKHKGVRLIDFGRGIDLSLFPAGESQRFVADWKTDEKDCVEMREGREWSFEADYFGLASVAYCLLFGKYIFTEAVEDTNGKTWRIGQPLKRYWQTELWTKLFTLCLNPKMGRPDGMLPITKELGDVRREFEEWLAENCQKGGKNLRSMLKKIETAAVMSGRRY